MAQFDIDDSVMYALDAALAAEHPSDTYVSFVDSAVHQLCSAQDVAYTNKIETEEYIEWNLAVFDGHGNVKGKNPYTGKYESYNLTLLALQEMIETKEMDAILSREIFSEEDSALAMQRALGKICVEKKISMIEVGATMVHAKIRRVFATKKITVDILSVGDSCAIIHQNGKKVLQSVEHTPFNEEELKRLRNEKRMGPNDVSNSNSFELLDANTVCSKPGRYVSVQGVLLAMTQSVGHIRYSKYDGISDEKGIFGLAPYKTHMEFSEDDHINIKLFSDGVSDIVAPDVVIDDQFFLIRSNAKETADFAKSRWEKEWKATTKTRWMEHLRTGEPLVSNTTKIGADDVACACWIGGNSI